MLAIPAHKRPLDSMEDILRVADLTSEYRFYVKNQSVSQETFLQATPSANPLFYAIGRKINATPRATFLHQSHVAELLDASEYNVVFTDRIGTQACSYEHIHAPVHLGSENYDNSFVGLVFRKKSPLMGPFNVVIKYLRETGIINRLIQLIVDNSKRRHKFRQISKSKLKATNEEKINEVKVFSFADLQSIFTITSVGILIALLTFAVECLHSGLLNFCNKMKNIN